MVEVSDLHFMHANNHLPHLPGCVGHIDTFPVRGWNTDGMYSGKYKAPVWKVQVVVNNLGQVAYVSGPHKGSMSDTRLARIFPSPTPPGRYLLGDKAYISIPGVLPPIKENDRHFSSSARKNYNAILGHYRSRVEQAIRMFKTWGCLSGRWRSHDAELLKRVVIVIASLRSISTSIYLPYYPYLPH